MKRTRSQSAKRFDEILFLQACVMRWKQNLIQTRQKYDTELMLLTIAQNPQSVFVLPIEKKKDIGIHQQMFKKWNFLQMETKFEWEYEHSVCLYRRIKDTKWECIPFHTSLNTQFIRTCTKTRIPVLLATSNSELHTDFF